MEKREARGCFGWKKNRREEEGVIYVGAIKKNVSYLHAIKKFGDTSMP
jgi:hypothetical protein